MKTFRVNKENSDIVTYDTETEQVNRYRGYLLGDIPRNFGCMEFGTRLYDENNNLVNGEDLDEGIPEWFNYKGLTYIIQ